MADFDKRDRWIMLGLVALGLFTVMAAVLSGGSAINYALEVEASNAAHAWSTEADKRLRGTPDGSDALPEAEALHVLDAAALRRHLKQDSDPAASMPTISVNENHRKFADRLQWLTSGLLSADPGRSGEDPVSKMEGFAVLSPRGEAMAVGGPLAPDVLMRTLQTDQNGAAIADAAALKEITVSALPGQDRKSLAIVPVIRNGNVA